MSRRFILTTFTIALALSLALVLSALGQALPQGVRQMASMGGITEYDFPNGLKVLLYPDAAQPKITVNVTYLVGSRHEGYGETGMAHLLEHMNFIESTTGRKFKDELNSQRAKMSICGTCDVGPAGNEGPSFWSAIAYWSPNKAELPEG